MKRVGQLFGQILDRDNLRLAAHRAMAGKRDRAQTRAFVADFDSNLDEMAAQLKSGTFRVGENRQFVIRDPKERVITAPCFRERVMHHAVMNVCEPHFDRWLSADTFACRKGLGRDAALRKAKGHAGRLNWFLKLDIRKYFDSVPHDRLLSLLARKFKDRELLSLFGRVVGAFRGNLGRGLPIGSLSSQHFANFYLSGFDRFARERLRASGYVRYMDDMALWADDKAELKAALAAAEDYLGEELGLDLKPTPYLNRAAHGMDFLGARVFPTHVTLNRRSRARFRRRLAGLERDHERGRIGDGELQRRAEALVAFTRAAGVSAWQFRRAVVQASAEGGRQAPTASCGAAAGTTTARTAARPTATGTTRRGGTGTTGSGSP